MKMIVAGGSGFIGSHIVQHWRNKGDQVLVLTRHPKKKDDILWNPRNKEVDRSIFEGADVVINVCGDSIMGRWTQKKIEKIKKSRLEPTEFLCQIISECRTPPKLYLGASAIGFYGSRGTEILTEKSPSGSGFLAELCRTWEGLAKPLSAKGVRVVFMRFGVVLGPDKGTLPQIAKPFRIGVGGTLGSGDQILSWIAIDDLIGAMELLIEQDTLEGPFNFTSPNAVTNRELTNELSAHFRKPTFFNMPASLLRLILKRGADEVFLSSADVRPERLLSSGFKFQMKTFDEVLKKYLPINK